MDAIKPVFRDVASVDLLKRCLHGKTHNPSESLNSNLDKDIQNCFCKA
jgi:hypothetical protein